MVQYLLLFLTMPADFTLSGYIDVAYREFPSVVTAAATDGQRLAIATFESGKTQIALYDSREAWAQRGSWHPVTGFAFDRFDQEGKYLESQFLPVPQYTELISKAEVGPQNPTGHMVPNAALPLGEGFAIVDFRGKRAVLFRPSTRGTN